MKIDIVERVAILSTSGEITKELNRISYNDAPPVWDLRKWKGDQMLKGIALTDAEMNALLAVFPS